jgi:sugar phosphate isomerase/epimerase
VDRIAIERLCVFGLPPVQFVDLAADLGCRYIATGFEPVRYNPHNYPKWSLREQPLRRETITALRARGVSISLLEGFAVRPDRDVSELAADLALAAEIGAERVNIVSADRDPQRTFDQLARFTEMNDAFGIQTVTEIGPGPIPNLRAALEAVRHVARPSFRLLIDTMHFVRFGSSVADLASVDPNIIGYVQLCDAPLVSTHASYLDEALHERMLPGTGELPLVDILAAIPPHVILGLEVPQRSLAEAGVGPHERVKRCIDAARTLLSQAGQGD